MEYDIILREFLYSDNEVMKLEAKLSLEFLKCKINECFKRNKSISDKNEENMLTHEKFEDCKNKCSKSLTKLKLIRTFLYQDFNETYYQRFLECGKLEDEKSFNKCIKDNKELMKKNIEEIKSIVLKYKY
jgi:hypothetical protein